MKTKTLNTLKKLGIYALKAIKWTFVHKSLTVTILRLAGLGTIATAVGITADTICADSHSARSLNDVAPTITRWINTMRRQQAFAPGADTHMDKQVNKDSDQPTDIAIGAFSRSADNLSSP